MIQPEHTGPTIVSVGETLFDCFKKQVLLGGAPANLAVHTQRLVENLGGRVHLISRIGRDELGEKAIKELAAHGIATDGIQRDSNHPTGRVVVEINSQGQPEYTIEENAAWDHIEVTDHALHCAAGCDAVCFGTLAQRWATSRQSVQELVRCAAHAAKVFDVNLRQAYFSRSVVEDSMRLATAVKLNDDELPRVCELLGIPHRSEDDQLTALLELFALDWIALTRGALGTVLCTRYGKFDGAPVTAQMNEHADAVGAGDACCAAIVVGQLMGWPPEHLVAMANTLGAFVAGHAGATPRIPKSLIAMLTPDTRESGADRDEQTT